MTRSATDHYGRARALVLDGDVLAWRGRSLIGRIVRHTTGESHSHVGLAMWLHGRLMAVEAVEGRGVVIQPVSRRLPVDWARPPAPIKADMSLALTRVGQSYSWLDAVRAGLGLRPKHAGWQCAEFVMAALKPGRAHAGATPGSVVDWILASGGWLKRLEG